jgi:hypothetical protein
MTKKKRQHVLMHDSQYKSRKETPPNSPHENPSRKAPKKKNVGNKRYDTR